MLGRRDGGPLMVGIVPIKRHGGLMARVGYSAATVMACLRADLVMTLQNTPAADRPAVMRSEIISAGGTMAEPAGSDWGPFIYEIALHGTTGTGTDLPEAISDWMKNARRMDTQ